MYLPHWHFPFGEMTQSINQQDWEKIRSGFVKDNYTKAMENALSSNPITDQWFNEYMFRIVVNNNYINEKAEMLPSWDPMF